MPHSGYSLAYLHPSHDNDADQGAARCKRRGIWPNGAFKGPNLWRKEHGTSYTHRYSHHQSYGYAPHQPLMSWRQDHGGLQSVTESACANFTPKTAPGPRPPRPLALPG